MTLASADPFVALRPRLIALAYRILGEAQGAEDIVQDAHERWLQHGAQVQAPRAWLERVTVHLALDQLKSARVRREVYVGPWLPEPVVTDDSVLAAGEREALSLAFMALLERLSPLERVAFILIESFDYSPREVAVLLERSEATVRQLLHRAREHVRAQTPRFAANRAEHLAVLETFVQTLQSGDLKALEGMLVANARAMTDGGGKTHAATQILEGAARVARFVFGVAAKLGEVELRIADLNGWPALITFSDGRVISATQLETDGKHIYALRAVVNPEKLQRLGRTLSQLDALSRP